LAVDAEAGNVAGKPAEGYGKMRLLELPRGSNLAGPGQVQNNFTSDTDIATELGWLRNNATVRNGNLLTLPVGGGLLYVQPVYVQAKDTTTQFPLLRKVLVSFGDEVALADTLDEALDDVFGGNSGVEAGDAEVKPEEVPTDELPPGPYPAVPTEPTTPTEPSETPSQEPSPSPSQTPGASGDPQARLDTALKDAKQAMEDSSAALAAGDFAKYGEAQDRLSKAVEAAIAAQGELK